MSRAIQQRPHVGLVPPGDVDHQHTYRPTEKVGHRFTEQQTHSHM